MADGPYSQTWEYDVLGNITDFDGTSYSYGTKPHAVTSVGAYSQSYDANGNMTGRANSTGTQTLTFDAENHLSQVVGTGGGYSGTATYVYDGDGNRIKKTEGGVTTVYPNRYYEKDVTTPVETSHYYLGGTQVAIKKGSTLEYLHQDSLNSSSLSTDSSGSQVSKTVFFAFGAARSSTGTLGTDQKYTGQRLDGTGLYFYNARYYDAGIGRFISPDNFVQLNPGNPLSSTFLTVNLAPVLGAPKVTYGSPANPQVLDRYAYSVNNPLRYSDPTGWRTWGLGLNFNIGLGGGLSVSFMFVWDDRGHKGISWSGGGGGYAGAGVSGAVQFQTTNATSIEQLRGPQVQVGGSAGVALVGGAEYVAGNGYQGTNISLGAGVALAPLPVVPVETHGFVEDSGVKVFGGDDQQMGSDTALTWHVDPNTDPTAGNRRGLLISAD